LNWPIWGRGAPGDGSSLLDDLEAGDGGGGLHTLRRGRSRPGGGAPHRAAARGVSADEAGRAAAQPAHNTAGAQAAPAAPERVRPARLPRLTGLSPVQRPAMNWGERGGDDGPARSRRSSRFWRCAARLHPPDTDALAPPELSGSPQWGWYVDFSDDDS
jgi:hypothetical protein